MQDLVPSETSPATLQIQGRITLLAQANFAKLSYVGSSTKVDEARRHCDL